MKTLGGRRAALAVAWALVGLLTARGSAAADAPAAPRPLDIEAYDVDGNTLLDQISVETAVYPYLGPDKTAADVERARSALEAFYHAHGFDSVVVEIPQQDVSDHIVR